MTRIATLTSTVARSPRRSRRVLALTAFAALSLAACGIEKTSAAGSQGKATEAVDAQHTEAPAS
ncbi:hypothetical protein ABZ904_33795 [Streptomyces sp. NPDC046900]|uniref:hypothetical protein n=1 Tax=Streptomyces sp. NPDC046900 TaxID=3155473 RepID=UPI0033E9DB98